MKDLKALTHAWLEAKADEAKANAHRVEIEQQMAALLPSKTPEETVKAEAAGYRIAVKYGLTRSVDSTALQDIWDSLTEKAQAAFSWKASIKVGELRKVQEFLPAEYAKLATAIESKPAKPSVSVEMLEKETV
jgi:hypothetical protein